MGSRLEKNSAEVRKRIEGHRFQDEAGEEYEASKFGGFTDYMRRKKIKLQNLDAEIRSHSTDKPPIFRGIVAYVNGYTQPSLSDLHSLIVSYGGGFLQYLDGKTAVTHVIASQLTPKKKVEFAKYRIVKPAWVVDSVNAGKLLPWEAYRVVDEGVTQKVLGFDGEKIVSQNNVQRTTYRDQSGTSWYTSQVRGVAQRLSGNADSTTAVMKTPERSLSSSLAHDRTTEAREGVQKNLSESTFPDPISPETKPRPRSPEKQQTSDDNVELTQTLQADDLEDTITSAAHQVVQVFGDGSAVSPGLEAVAGPEVSLSAIDAAILRKIADKRPLSAEEHNAVLLSNPHMAKSSTANPDFINQYYRESRLHHLSTWKADLKAQLQARAAAKSSSQKANQKRIPGQRRYIMHIDFDSFFAAVSLRKNPHLVEHVVVIAHGSGPGSEIASCNYPARKYGIKNGMWMKTALQLCSDIKVLPYDYKAYEEASRHFYDSILAVDGIVQSISIDEALLDVSQQCVQAGGSDGKAISEGSIYREQNKANELAQKIRNLVREKTGCDVSVGIGGNILLAKTALRKAKPAGQYQIKPEEVLDFIGELTVTELPGVAYSIGSKLEEVGVKYVKDIRSLTKERLINTLGPKTGEKIWEYSRGIDRTEVGEQVVRKSVSAEINWGIRFVTQQQAEEFVQALCDELAKRLLEQAVKGRQLTMKIMRKAADAGMDPPKNLGHGKCDTFNKSVVLGVASNDNSVLGKEAISIMRSYGFPPGELRGLGVQMQKLEPLKYPATTLQPTYDSSQRRLQFKRPDSPTPVPKLKDQKAPPKDPLNSGAADPIEDIPTPEKPVGTTIVPSAPESSDSEVNADDLRKPLNISGTQFILPTQIDPEVLAEFPADIRSKFAPRPPHMVDDDYKDERLKRVVKGDSRSASPYPSDTEAQLPSQSQLDPEILGALPDDVRAEVLSHYRTGRTVSSRATKGQQILPQSPRKAKIIPPNKKLVLTLTKKSKTSTAMTRLKQRSGSSAFPTLTQSNFVSLAKGAAACGQHGAHLDEVSESFLEELPEDIRLELLAEQKRQRLQSRSGLSIGESRKKRRAHAGAEADPSVQRRMLLPPPPEKPTFTSRKLSTLRELREAMSAWVDEFSVADEEGPFDEDVAALAEYLYKVVKVECDMSKAVGITDWVIQCLNEQEDLQQSTSDEWSKALTTIKGRVQVAVQERGLPPVAFVDD